VSIRFFLLADIYLRTSGYHDSFVAKHLLHGGNDIQLPDSGHHLLLRLDNEFPACIVVIRFLGSTDKRNMCNA
jgi:hypothetical protein